MKITLHTPPDGYEAEAEYRVPVYGEKVLFNGNVKTFTPEFFGTTTDLVVLTPKRQRAEVRRYWATIKATGNRHQFSSRTGIWFYIETNAWHVNDLDDIKAIDPEYLDTPPVPQKDWWTGMKKPRDGVNDVLVWNGEAWLRRYVSNIAPTDIWRYQPPAPSVTRTEAQPESEAADA